MDEDMNSKAEETEQTFMKTKFNLGLLCLSVMSPMKSKSMLLVAVAAGLGSALAFKVQAQTAVQAWVQRYSAPANSIYTGQKLAVDSSGNVIVVGNGDTGTGNNWLAIKYTGAGTMLWTNRYSGLANESAFASAVAVDGSGNVFVTGESQGTNSASTTIKYSSAGVPLWTNRFGPASVSALAVDGSANVVVAGENYATIKYSNAGVPLWTNRYNGTLASGDFDAATAVAVDGSGNVFVTGYSDHGGGVTANIATVAYSGAGLPLWTNLYQHSATSYDGAIGLAVDGSGNVFVTGTSGDDLDRYITIKYSGSGVSLWTNHYDGPTNINISAAIALDGGGNAIVTGYSVSSGYDYDYATIKYSNAGVPLWTNRYNGPGTSYETAAGLAVDGSGNVFVTGYSDHNDGSADFATVAYSGSGVALWTNVYHGPVASYDTANAVAVDTNGNMFVTGSSAGNFATISYSGAGVPLWTNRFNDELGNSIDEAAAVIVDGAGNVFVTGYSTGIGSGYDFATIKYSGAGVALWTNRYNGPGNGGDIPYVMAADSGGNVIVAGSSWSGTSSGYATIKYSGAGMALWTNRYNGPGNSYDYANGLAVDTKDNVFVTGSSIGSSGNYDYATIKYSSAGVPLWTNRYDGPGNSNDYANALAVDASGDVFVTGSATVSTNGHSDYATIKYSGAGVALWTNLYNGPGNGDDQALAAGVDSSGNVFVTGKSVGINDNLDYATIKYSSAGVPLWTRRYTGPYFIDMASTLAVDAGGNVIVTGESLEYSGSFAFATVKYSGAGVMLWANRYNDPSIGTDLATSIALDAGGNVFVSGSSSGTGTGQDYTTIALSSAGVSLWTNHYNGPGNGQDFPGISIRYPTLVTRQALAVGADGSVYVTGSSDAGSRGTAFDFATVKYVVPPRLAGPGLTNGHFAFTVSGSSGASVEILASTNLQSWSPLVTNTLVGGTNYFSDPQSADANGRFYRALLLQ
jgi:hypothetical protein